MVRIMFEIATTLKKYAGKPLKQCRVLDIGCWEGRISLPLAPHVKSIHGIDIRRSPLFRGKNVRFVKGNLFDYLKKCNQRFDIIICSEVIEHIDDQKSFLKEVRKCLADDGIVYLTTNNKYWWKEGHYGLPFLTYLPKGIQKKYIKLFNKERKCGYDVTELFSYRRLKRMLEKCGYSAEFIAPEGLDFPYSIMKYLIKGPIWNFSMGFMVIARKRV